MNSNHRAATALIANYISHLPQPKWIGHDKSVFRYNSLVKWAAKEVLSAVEERPNEAPLVVIEDFMAQMDTYQYLHEDLDDWAGYVFTVGYEVAQDISDYLLSSKNFTYQEDDYE